MKAVGPFSSAVTDESGDVEMPAGRDCGLRKVLFLLRELHRRRSPFFLFSFSLDVMQDRTGLPIRRPIV
jgi:hypothetical protein